MYPLLSQLSAKGRKLFFGLTAATLAQFVTAQAIIDSYGNTGGTITLPDYATVTETLTIPTTATGTWEIRSDSTLAATLVGNIVCTTTAQVTLKLTNLNVTGNLSGQATSGAGNILYVDNCKFTGTVSLTGTGSGFWYTMWQGRAANFSFGFGGFVTSTCSVFGAIYANTFAFLGALTYGAAEFRQCYLPSSHTLDGSSTRTALISDSAVASSVTFTGSGGTATITADQATITKLFIQTLTLTSSQMASCIGVYKKAVVSYSANVGSTNIIGSANNPAGMYQVNYVNEVTAGTAIAAVANLVYVGRNGTLTQAITAAISTGQASGIFTFYHDGSAPLKYTITGVTPTGLSASLSIEVQYLGNVA